MEQLNEKQLGDLLLTKAMEEYAGKEERFDSLNDVIDEVFANSAIDREEYLHGVMELTQKRYIKSDIASEEDIEMSEAVGYDISGLTELGNKYIEDALKQTGFKDMVIRAWKGINKACEKLNDTPVFQTITSIL